MAAYNWLTSDLPEQPKDQEGGFFEDLLAEETAAAVCPPGLDCLKGVDKIGIRREEHPLTEPAGPNENVEYTRIYSRRYRVYNTSEQQQIFCVRNDVTDHGTMIYITDYLQNEEMLRIEVRTGTQCCSFCSSKGKGFGAVVATPDGKVIGKVKQEKSCFTQRLSLLIPPDEQGDDSITAGMISFCEVPFGNIIRMFSDREFTITAPDGSEEMGRIARKSTCSNGVENPDDYSVMFPGDMEVQMKCLFIGALFLMDRMLYDNRGTRNNILCC